MTYAIIKTGGKQYKVQPGDVLEVEQLATKANEKHIFSDVLMFANGSETKIGNPLVNGITVEALVIGNVKGEKIRVSKFKAKAKYRRTTGHRQHLTQVKIEAVGNVKSDKQPIRQAQGKEAINNKETTSNPTPEKKPAVKKTIVKKTAAK